LILLRELRMMVGVVNRNKKMAVNTFTMMARAHQLVPVRDSFSL